MAFDRKSYNKRYQSENLDEITEKKKLKRAERRAMLLAIKSAGCSRCNEKHPACIDFHHLDPSVKETCVGVAVNRNWSWDRVLCEIEKCELLCANCHRKEQL